MSIVDILHKIRSSFSYSIFDMETNNLCAEYDSKVSGEKALLESGNSDLILLEFDKKGYPTGRSWQTIDGHIKERIDLFMSSFHERLKNNVKTET